MPTELKFEQGNTATAIAIMNQVAAWCETKQYNMWKPHELTLEVLLQNRTRDHFYVATSKGEPIAAMILDWQDPKFWPDCPANDAVYLHKLCVLPNFTGNGISGAMVDFARQICRINSKNYLRLDTGADHPKLCAMYQRLGFRHVANREIGAKLFALFEMVIQSA